MTSAITLWPARASFLVLLACTVCAENVRVFDVKAFGASGNRSDDARSAIQRALDACAAAGGGVVRVPPGAYTAGTLRLRSGVHLEIQAGATLFAAPRPEDYDYDGVPSKAAVLFGEGLDDISISGGGTVDGQAQYEWREDDFERAFGHKTLMQQLGKPLRRSFPKGFPQRTVYPHLAWIGHSKNVRIAGLRFRNCPNWTLLLTGCEQVRFEQLNIQSSLKEGVWADGIDLDGCRGVTVTNCVIETGDDCLVFISENSWGPPRACEDVVVSRCQLSSASAGVKFSEGNRLGIRNVLIHDTVLTNVNRGFVFSTTFGGSVSDVLISNVTVHCSRFDWFWAGDGQPFYFRPTRLSELNEETPRPGEAAPGEIRNVRVCSVRAHAKGSSMIAGHPERPLRNIRFENVSLRMSADPSAPFDQADHALHFRAAQDVHLTNVTVSWGEPALETWQSALRFDDVRGLVVEGFVGRGAWPQRNTPALVLHDVAEAFVRGSHASEGTSTFLKVSGPKSGTVTLRGNDLRHARVPWEVAPGLRGDVVQATENAR